MFTRNLYVICTAPIEMSELDTSASMQLIILRQSSQVRS